MDLPDQESYDEQALEAARERDRAAAFQRLFDAQFDPIRCFLYRYVRSAEDARDLTHDTFLRLWQRRHELDFTADLRPYLYGIARRAGLDVLRHRRVVERYLLDTTGHGVEVADDPEDMLREKEVAAAIQQAVDMLPPRQKQVITLRWQRKMSYEQIARELGLSAKTIDNHVHRAFAQLRTCLSGLLDR